MIKLGPRKIQVTFYKWWPELQTESFAPGLTFVITLRNDKKKINPTLAGMAHLVGASSRKWKGRGFDSQSG